MDTASHVSGTVPGDRRLNISREAERTVLWLAGEHDLSTMHGVADALAKAMYLDDGADLVIDLSAVTFMDATTVGLLIRGRNLLLRQSRNLTVRAGSAAAERIVHLFGLTRLLESTDTDAAVPEADPLRVRGRGS